MCVCVPFCSNQMTTTTAANCETQKKKKKKKKKKPYGKVGFTRGSATLELNALPRGH